MNSVGLNPGAFGRDRASDWRHDAEKSQAVVRIVIAFFFLLSLCAMMAFDRRKYDSVHEFFYLMLAVQAASIFVFAAVAKYPGVYHSRRVSVMFLDYGVLTYGLIEGGYVLIPLYAILLWVTVGNGLRYGVRYLAAATAIALCSLGLVIGFTPYWSSQPYLAFTFILTTIIVPAYAFSLLTRLRRASEAAAAANAAKSRFLAEASHDLRQPIHAIGLFTNCLLDAPLRPEERELVESIDKSLNSVSLLFRSLLDVSTLDAGGVVTRMEVVRLGPLLQDVIRQNSKATEWTDSAVRQVDCALYVRTDAGLLATMVQNILSNALKYAPGEAVLVGCRRRRGRLAIEIWDRGIGIEESHLPRIFDEFYRIKERGHDVDGIGLGLSIVKRLADVLGLAVSVRSRRGRGTVFAIEELEIVDGPAAAEEVPKPVIADPLDGLRILLIDDERDALKATADLLERWGCIVQAETARPGTIRPCDIIIADHDLGSDITGIDCIAHARRVLDHKVPAIIVTGGDVRAIADELDDHSTPVISKPLRPAELRSLVGAQKRGGKAN